MVIDAHAHACGELSSIEGIMTYLKKNQLDKIVLCPGENNSHRNYPVPMIADFIPNHNISYGFNQIIKKVVKLSGVSKTLEEQNQLIGNMALQYPNQILHAYWLNPLEENCLEQMKEFYKKMPFIMIKMHQCWHPFNLESPIIVEVIEWAQQQHLPIFIHLLSTSQSNILCDLANQHPDCLFIVGHMIGFDIIAPKLKYSNVYFDISAPFMIPFSHLEEAVKLWGGNRLILGSDTPYGNGNIVKNKKRIERLQISIEEKEKILGENLSSILTTQL